MILLHTAVVSLVLAGAGDTVLLDFFSDSCMPCRQMDPTVRQLAGMGYPVRRVNCSREPELASRFAVRQIPCFVMVVDGREVDRVIGATSLARLEQMCKLAPSRSPDVAQAQIIPAKQSGPDLSALSSSAPPAGPDLAALVAATVRLRIEDSKGHSCGSGTIIDARDGEALILTCGHIFRDSQGKGRIEVDLFGRAPAQRLPGRLLHYDPESDIGLLTIRVPGPVAVARVAPPGYRLSKGDAVVNVGCNNGESPTARRSHVTAVDKYMGPSNVEVAGLPVQGRSGGGLFSGDGLVIGVCNAADPTDNDGLYAALSAVQAELDRVKLSSIYRSRDREGPAVDAAVAVVDPPPMAKQMPLSENATPSAEDPARASQPPMSPGPTDSRQALSDPERAALEEIQRRKLEGAEVICVIRSRLDARAQSQIIVLDKVSPAFFEQLAGDARPQDQRHLTSLEIPRRPQTGAETPGPAVPAGPPRKLLEYIVPSPGNMAPPSGPVW